MRIFYPREEELKFKTRFICSTKLTGKSRFKDENSSTMLCFVYYCIINCQSQIIHKSQVLHFVSISSPKFPGFYSSFPRGIKWLLLVPH